MEQNESILIYVYRINTRVHYIFRFIFEVLRVPFRFTTKIEEFVAYNGPKFSYTKERLAGEFHIHASGLLDEKGIKTQTFKTGSWEGLPTIFHTEQNASLPFDLISAIFYLITRYEEYLDFQSDTHNRFDYRNSIAYKMKFLHIPLIDLWIDRFKHLFEEQNPGYHFPEPLFKFRPLMAVNISHLFKHKGLIRQVGGFMDNLFQLNFKNLKHRLLYSFSRKRDPYDNFYKIIALKKKYHHSLISFFLVGSFSDYDHNLPVSRPALRKVIKTMSDYSEIGLSISYHHFDNEEMIKKEQKSLESIIHKPVTKSRFHYFKQKIPVSYRILDKLEFKDDFSCGYPQIPGFRASTSYPFPFYDLEEEFLTDLIIHPVVISDYHLNFKEKLSPEKALEKLLQTGDTIRKTGGYFQPVFHNSILSEFEEWKNWSQVYIKTLEHYA